MMNDLLVDKLFDIAKDRTPIARARIVAAVVHKKLDQPIIAWNSMKTHPFQARWGADQFKVSLHAETSAIHKALKVLDVEDFEKADLYVVRAKLIENKWVHGLAKPCTGCARCIATFGLKNVYYTREV
jgi:tRNA(Arg) A34 adenosine deaminase TadA